MYSVSNPNKLKASLSSDVGTLVLHGVRGLRTSWEPSPSTGTQCVFTAGLSHFRLLRVCVSLIQLLFRFTS